MPVPVDLHVHVHADLYQRQPEKRHRRRGFAGVTCFRFTGAYLHAQMCMGNPPGPGWVGRYASQVVMSLFIDIIARIETNTCRPLRDVTARRRPLFCCLVTE